MGAPDPNEIWQVEVGGQVYEAPFAELGTWIGEGSLLPGDKVRKGNLRWIEARRVPSLVPFFNAKENGLPMPVVVSATDTDGDNETAQAGPASFPETLPVESPVMPALAADPIDHSIAVPAEPQSAERNPDICAIHNDVASVFLCSACGSGFCKVCPKAYGASVRLCPFCGGLCRSINEIRQKQAATTRRTTAISEGFGAADFFKALAHPFRFKASLILGAIMFMVFSLGQSASGIGGIYMLVGAIFCVMLANMLTFGVLANTIDSFTRGNLDANFMPSYEDFELWDDVIHPFFLSIGAYISSFGPFALVMIIGFYLIVSSVSSQMDAFQQNVERIPGSHAFDTRRTAEQSDEVRDVLADISNKQAARLDEFDELAANTDLSNESPDARETREQEELWEMAQQSRRQNLESVIGKSPETQEKESRAMLQSFLGLAAPLVVIGAIFFLWGAFYFPAACAVAGYTRSFTATINPLVGLDTIGRLGGTYFKILLMGLVLVIASGLVGAIAGAVLAPFDMPAFGNLPAKAIGALFGFYLSVVFSCILGYALFKKSDKLLLAASD